MKVLILDNNPVFLTRMEQAFKKSWDNDENEVWSYSTDEDLLDDLFALSDKLESNNEMLPVLDISLNSYSEKYFASRNDVKYEDISIHGLNIYNLLRRKFASLKIVLVSSYSEERLISLCGDPNIIQKDKSLHFAQRIGTSDDIVKSILKFYKR